MLQPAEPSPYRHAFAGVVAMAVAMGIGRFVYTPILPIMMAGLGLTASDAGLIASANFVGYLAGAVLAAGGWAEGHERLLVLWSLALSALLAGAMGLTENLAAFLVIRFFGGVASAFVLVFLSTILFSRLAAAGRPHLQLAHFSGVGVGIIASSLITGAGFLVDAGWEVSWLLSGAVSALGFVLVWALLDRVPVALADGRTREPPLPRSSALTRIILAYGLFGFGYIVTATFLVAIVRAGEAGPLFESAVWLVTGLAILPSVYLWSRFGQRIGLASAFGWGAMVQAAGIVASVTLGGWIGPLVGGVLLGGTFVAATALGLQAGRQLAGAAPRRALAMMTAAFGLGQIIGPIVGGYIADSTGDFVLSSMLAASALVACGVIAWSAARA